ncbi:hypothetical protein SODALDRAFT_170167 [Sodiomyces alkalinus F11]|uniref:Uncharacterized protein n=1 Tax=Sodiomyces alkalinus (strain CBS 110278 / VKM F-3762 / F11) TaxID=1314773 RepID=A0A3N2PW75_SODAK|nr:hypothetical protein SODALDRAFT_170167 [Sodiomyces alkalinus F11]ROT38744.1 hypothetical protein SODALDRAFT_170167 [Sodiomyces alkalinus F11]
MRNYVQTAGNTQTFGRPSPFIPKNLPEPEVPLNLPMGRKRAAGYFEGPRDRSFTILVVLYTSNCLGRVHSGERHATPFSFLFIRLSPCLVVSSSHHPREPCPLHHSPSSTPLLALKYADIKPRGERTTRCPDASPERYEAKVRSGEGPLMRASEIDRHPKTGNRKAMVQATGIRPSCPNRRNNRKCQCQIDKEKEEK